MMNIREHFEMLRSACDWDVVDDLEKCVFELYEVDEELFTQWATGVGIDLNAIDKNTNEYVVTLWAWDMCGD